MIPLDCPANIALVAGFLAAPSDELRERLKQLAYLRERPGLVTFADEVTALIRAELERRAAIVEQPQELAA